MKETDGEIRFLPEADATRMTVGDECSHTCFYWGGWAEPRWCVAWAHHFGTLGSCVCKDDMTIID